MLLGKQHSMLCHAAIQSETVNLVPDKALPTLIATTGQSMNLGNLQGKQDTPSCSALCHAAVCNGDHITTKIPQTLIKTVAGTGVGAGGGGGGWGAADLGRLRQGGPHI